MNRFQLGRSKSGYFGERLLPTSLVTFWLVLMIAIAYVNLARSETTLINGDEFSVGWMLEHYTCESVLAMTRSEINVENARPFFLKAMSCNIGSSASGGQRLQSGTFLDALRYYSRS